MLSKRYEADGIPTFEMNSLQLEMKGQIERKVREGMYRFEMITGDEAMVAVITQDLTTKEDWKPVDDYDSVMTYLTDREAQIK